MVDYENVNASNILIEPVNYNNANFSLIYYGYLRVQYTSPSVSYNSDTKILTITGPRLQTWGTNSASSSYGTFDYIYLGYNVYLVQ